ncbi:YciI family protein [Pseudooctadecabacter sp.]|uniref:YciI family protein n=1 Tax=Pseudooctadecabacter sp. TaxID=1966338 RepID=UPI0025D8E522|nr:YciI family protein [Pseudooctadecabacter sp.]
MRFAVITRDKPDALQIRLDTRDAHLAYIKDTGVVEMAGPFLDPEGTMCGSLIILTVDSLSAAQSWADNDPYAKAGLFKHVRVEEWKKVIG